MIIWDHIFNDFSSFSPYFPFFPRNLRNCSSKILFLGNQAIKFSLQSNILCKLFTYTFIIIPQIFLPTFLFGPTLDILAHLHYTCQFLCTSLMQKNEEERRLVEFPSSLVRFSFFFLTAAVDSWTFMAVCSSMCQGAVSATGEYFSSAAASLVVVWQIFEVQCTHKSDTVL